MDDEYTKLQRASEMAHARLDAAAPLAGVIGLLVGYIVYIRTEGDWKYSFWFGLGSAVAAIWRYAGPATKTGNNVYHAMLDRMYGNRRPKDQDRP